MFSPLPYSMLGQSCLINLSNVAKNAIAPFGQFRYVVKQLFKMWSYGKIPFNQTDSSPVFPEAD